MRVRRIPLEEVGRPDDDYMQGTAEERMEAAWILRRTLYELAGVVVTDDPCHRQIVRVFRGVSPD